MNELELIDAWESVRHMLAIVAADNRAADFTSRESAIVGGLLSQGVPATACLGVVIQRRVRWQGTRG